MAGNLRNHLSAWETILKGHPKADELYDYLSFGVDISKATTREEVMIRRFPLG